VKNISIVLRGFYLLIVKGFHILLETASSNAVI